MVLAIGMCGQSMIINIKSTKLQFKGLVESCRLLDGPLLEGGLRHHGKEQYSVIKRGLRLSKRYFIFEMWKH